MVNFGLPAHSHEVHGDVNQQLVQNGIRQTPQPAYDVAISYVPTERFIASSLAARLSESLNVFYCSRSQDDLPGAEQLQRLQAAFTFGSRVVVVLYREPWGETDWTRVEQSAIIEACKLQGWHKLFFVEVDRRTNLPSW